MMCYIKYNNNQQIMKKNKQKKKNPYSKKVFVHFCTSASVICCYIKMETFNELKDAYIGD